MGWLSAIQIVRHPAGLLPSGALAIQQIHRAIELQENSPQGVEFFGHLGADGKRRWGNSPLMSEEQAVRWNVIPDETGGLGRTHSCAALLPVSVHSRKLSPNLTGPQPNPLVSRQLFQAHWSARSHFVGADANFRAHSKFTAIREPGGGVPIDGGAIHSV